MRANIRHVWDARRVSALRGAVSNDALPGVRPDAFAGGVADEVVGERAVRVLSGNPKPETRNPKEIRRPRSEATKPLATTEAGLLATPWRAVLSAPEAPAPRPMISRPRLRPSGFGLRISAALPLLRRLEQLAGLFPRGVAVGLIHHQLQRFLLLLLGNSRRGRLG